MKPVHLNDSSTRLTNIFESFSSKSAKFSRNRSSGLFKRIGCDATRNCPSKRFVFPRST